MHHQAYLAHTDTSHQFSTLRLLYILCYKILQTVLDCSNASSVVVCVCVLLADSVWSSSRSNATQLLHIISQSTEARLSPSTPHLCSSAGALPESRLQRHVVLLTITRWVVNKAYDVGLASIVSIRPHHSDQHHRVDDQQTGNSHRDCHVQQPPVIHHHLTAWTLRETVNWYDTIAEFNVDSKSECDQLNLAHVARREKKTKKKKHKQTNASAHLLPVPMLFHWCQVNDVISMSLSINT